MAAVGSSGVLIVSCPYVPLSSFLWFPWLTLMSCLVLSEELGTAMKLLGITSLDQARPEMVNAIPLLNEMWRPEAVPRRSRL